MTMYYSHARKRQKRDAQGMILEAILTRRGPQREPDEFSGDDRGYGSCV